MVGERFKADPRLPALDWIQANVHRGLRLESSAGAPHWSKNEALGIVEVDAMVKHPRTVSADGVMDLRLPHCNGRAQLFDKIFAKNKWVAGQAGLHEGISDEALFTPEALAKRNPDIITVDLCDMVVPSPTVRAFFENLTTEKFPYKVVYDRQSPRDPGWIYPKEIDFLQTRCVILVRKQDSSPGALPLRPAQAK